MRKLLLASLVWGFAMAIGTSAALAGGASSTSGQGLHCYMFFDDCGKDNDEFAQAMINQDLGDKTEVMKIFGDFIIKYVEGDDKCVLAAAIGNVAGVCDCLDIRNGSCE